ncbi:hypothetical protein ACFL6S_15755 [Candidatus Poribacteria bacterium]
MRIWVIIALMLMFTAAAHAQFELPVIDFFLHDRPYDTFLRDYFRFNEPKPLRVEYSHTSWQDSDERSTEFSDYLHLEGMLPIYLGGKLTIDIPFQFSHVPIWAESEETLFGDSINLLDPHLMTRWTFSDRLKAIVGWEYTMKGVSENFGKTIGKRICLLKGYVSYDLNSQLNVVAGSRLDRYLYDTDEESGAFELADRLYYQPALMLNWHPNERLTLLLGMPYTGVHLKLGDMVKAEARANIDKKAEIALSVSPVERVIATLKFSNTPYKEYPIRKRGEDESLIKMLSYTDKSVALELGWKLNPAALASLALRYGSGGDVELKDRYNENILEELDGKAHFDVGATFTMALEALLGMR